MWIGLKYSSRVRTYVWGLLLLTQQVIGDLSEIGQRWRCSYLWHCRRTVAPPQRHRRICRSTTQPPRWKTTKSTSHISEEGYQSLVHRASYSNWTSGLLVCKNACDSEGAGRKASGQSLAKNSGLRSLNLSG